MIFHDVPQNSEAWEALRLGKATASNFSKFMANDGKAFGDPAKRYALQLALERHTGRKSEYSFKNDDMERGNEQGLQSILEHGAAKIGLVRDRGTVNTGHPGRSARREPQCP